MLTTFILIIVGFYVIYRIFLHFPSLLWKRKRVLGKKGFAEIIGHRGSRNSGLPENTISAFIHAAKVGVEVIELDVWLTKDDKVVVFHDSTLTRMTSGNHSMDIRHLNYSELPNIVPSQEQSHHTSKYSDHHWNKIPLLSEVFEHLPHDIAINIEFKMDSDKLIQEVMKLLHKYNRENTVFWFSLNEKINSKLRKANPNIPTITSVVGSMFILFLHYTFLLPFYPIKDDVFGITLYEITMNEIESSPLKTLPKWIKILISYLFYGSPPYIMMSSSLFQHLRARGIPVWFMFVNTDRELDLANKYGATAALTDRADWLINRMKERNIHFKKIS